jgi:hypothetical protein
MRGCVGERAADGHFFGVVVRLRLRRRPVVSRQSRQGCKKKKRETPQLRGHVRFSRPYAAATVLLID